MNDKRTTPTGEINDVGIMAKRLREWVHGRFGVWVTFATAMRAIRFVLRGEKWFIEHVDALILGGPEAADNRRPSHVEKCKAKKDAADAAARSKRDRIITKDWQREAPKLRSAPFAQAAPKRRATTPIAPKFDGDILSRNLRRTQ